MKVLVVLLFCASMQAQEKAQLIGVIRDATGAAVPGTEVSVYNVDIGVRRTTRTDDHGFYAVASLRPGSYKITVRRPGFRTIARTGVMMGATERARLDFLLEIGATHEEITVQGDAEPITTNDATSLMILKRDPIDNLPLNGRGVQALTEFAPGLLITPATRGEAGQFTANGQRPNTNYFTVDGVSVNNAISGSGLPGEFSAGALPGMTAIGSLHGLVSALEIEEVRVQTSTYAPEFGRLPGAQVAIVTSSGSNDFHGEFFGSLRPRQLGASDDFAKRARLDPSRGQSQAAGGVISGPLTRNRTFFFAGSEWLGVKQAAAWRIPVPSLDTRRSASGAGLSVLNAFPVPERSIDRFTAEHTAQTDWPGRVLRHSIRLDHALSPSTLAFVRYGHTFSESRAGYMQANEARFRSTSVTVGVLNVFGPRITSDARIGVSTTAVDSRWSSLGLGGAQPLDFSALLSAGFAPGRSVYALSIPGYTQFVSAEQGRSRQLHWNVMETLAVNAGAHQLRAGIDYQRLMPERENAILGQIGVYSSMAEVVSGARPSISELYAPAGASVIESFSAFAQDTWHVNPRMNLTYGVRWELTPAPSYKGVEPGASIGVTSPPVSNGGYIPVPAFGTEILPGGTTSGAVWKTRYTQFAPRIGAAYRLTRDGTLVIRSGTGIFYDVGFSAITDVLNGTPFNRWIVALAAPTPSQAAPPIVYGYATGLKLPWSAHWNVSLEKLFGRETVLSAAYVGSRGRHLLRLQSAIPDGTNPTQTVLAGNQGSSDYHSLQLQARRSISRGLRGFAGYTWGHSIDNGSWNSATFQSYPGANDRGASDFDVQHSFHAGILYDLSSSAIPRWSRGWSLSGILRARTGFPIDVLSSENPFGLSFDNQRPDLRWGVPIWVDDTSAPGGRRLNAHAFAPAATGRQGSLGRNAIRGFGLTQVDLALQRRFRMGERASAAFRIEAYNVANRAYFADPARFLSNPLFGQSLSHTSLLLGTGRAQSGLSPTLQPGGPRSVQFRIEFRF
jgi:hypothetical protein